MKKIVKVGWVEKNDKVDIGWAGDDPYLHIWSVIFQNKGTKSSWGGNWPPRKVRITVEEIE